MCAPYQFVVYETVARSTEYRVNDTVTGYVADGPPSASNGMLNLLRSYGMLYIPATNRPHPRSKISRMPNQLSYERSHEHNPTSKQPQQLHRNQMHDTEVSTSQTDPNRPKKLQRPANAAPTEEIPPSRKRIIKFSL